MKLSVIIPAYNVQNTLRRCVKSVLEQDVSEAEVILIDDGSTDDTSAIVDELAAHHSSIIAIHQANGGLSKARNAGIDIAKGKYITFVDSDDYLAAGTYKQLVSILAEHPEYDILEYSFTRIRTNKSRELIPLESGVYDNITNYWLKVKAYTHTYAWNKIYKRSLFEEVRFVEGKLFEDVYTYPRLLTKAKVIATTPLAGYHYEDNPKGITHNAGGKGLQQLLEAHLRNLPIWEHIDKTYYEHLLNIQMDVYELTHMDPILPRLPFKGTLKLNILYIIGLRNICKINSLLHRLYRKSH